MDNNLHLHAGAAASAGLAASIGMAISVLIGISRDPSAIGTVLHMGIALASIAFGGTYAGVFFGRLAANAAAQRRARPA